MLVCVCVFVCVCVRVCVCVCVCVYVRARVLRSFVCLTLHVGGTEQIEREIMGEGGWGGGREGVAQEVGVSG